MRKKTSKLQNRSRETDIYIFESRSEVYFTLTLLGLHVCLLIISLIIFFIFFCLARSSRVGDLKKNTRTPHARSCTAPQINAVPAKGQQKTLKSKIYKKGKSFH